MIDLVHENLKLTLRGVLVLALLALLALPATAQDPYEKPDDSWISISGTAVEPTASSFLLDYGEGVITVEMDDFDSYGDAHGLLDGDKVTVYGRIDDDLYETRTIEASSVYVENLSTYFYASAADEEDWAYWTVTVPVVVGQTSVRGTVTNIDESEGEFTLNTGVRDIVVETEELGYNPLDEYGFQQIDVGDRVSVIGDMDYDFLEGYRFEAESVTTLTLN